MTTRFRRMLATIAAAGVVLAGAAVPEPAQAVSNWSGKDPFGAGACGTWTESNQVLRMHETYVYDESTLVGYGYLAWSPKCQTNWSEFWYANEIVWANHTVEPSAWEQGKTGTDQYSKNLDDYNLVYSSMVDGRGPACAGAQLYKYGPRRWVTWYMFGCE
ncbi:DUF2690 domain-containing protein [Dactylosporangium sp. NPDC000521]|uniref:DUF2690 domain-containing protein n=1 Tax=Dactylosporangium sp. NPDC000521 TaxID=3363975 RepID=UPI0036A8425D